MKALITGGQGFVGRHLTAHLRAQGDDVVAVDRHGGPDLADAPGWRAALVAQRPEVVYHLAAQSAVGASWADPGATFRANAEGTLNVLAGCVEAKVGRVILVSSADVYGAIGPDELPVRESNPTRPVTPYAASKLAAEAVGLQAYFGNGLPVIIVRPFNHLGPGQDDRFVAGALAARIAANEVSGQSELSVGNLSAERDFTDVRDVVRAYRLLAASGVPGETYHVCSGRATAVATVAETLVGLSGKAMRLVVDPALHRPVDVPVVVGDASKLTAACGWRPEVPLSTTLADLLDDARTRTRNLPA